MGFPVPGDAFEQSIDLNRQVVTNPAATFFMRVEGDLQPNHDVQPGDLLVVDRSLTVKDQALVGQPVVVLSNNDGCVVARSPEAKRLVAMQTSLYEIRDRVQRGEIYAFSSNPELYRDMSRRVIETLQHFSPEVEQ